jgi:DNA-binding transcriptional ArsR family regulator
MFNPTEYTDHLMELTFRATDSPTTQEQVLGFLLDEAGEPATEVAVRNGLDQPKTTTHVALSALVEQGLVEEERVGRTCLYLIDPSDPLVKTLKMARDAERVLTELARHQWLQPVVKTPEAHMQLIAEAATFAKEVARGTTVWERR